MILSNSACCVRVTSLSSKYPSLWNREESPSSFTELHMYRPELCILCLPKECGKGSKHVQHHCQYDVHLRGFLSLFIIVRPLQRETQVDLWTFQYTVTVVRQHSIHFETHIQWREMEVFEIAPRYSSTHL